MRKDYDAHPRYKCAVCGRHFIVRHKGWACSKKCRQRLEEIKNPIPRGLPRREESATTVTAHSGLARYLLRVFSLRPQLIRGRGTDVLSRAAVRY